MHSSVLELAHGNYEEVLRHLLVDHDTASVHCVSFEFAHIYLFILEFEQTLTVQFACFKVSLIRFEVLVVSLPGSPVKVGPEYAIRECALSVPMGITTAGCTGISAPVRHSLFVHGFQLFIPGF